MKQLSLIEKAFFLKKLHLFNDLNLDLLIAIAEKMHQDFYNKGEVIFNTKQHAYRMYFLITGNVEVFSPKEKKLYDLFPGDYFGEEALFNEKPRTYLTKCSCDCSFLTLTCINLMNIITECPSVAIALLKDYADNTPHKVFRIREKANE